MHVQSGIPGSPLSGEYWQTAMREGRYVDDVTYMIHDGNPIFYYVKRSLLVFREPHGRSILPLGQGGDLGTRLRNKLSLFGHPVELDHWT